MNEVGFAEYLERVVRRLAFPRFSGSVSMKKAEQILLDECKQQKITPVIEPFETSAFFMQHINTIPYFLMGVLVFITSLLAIIGTPSYILLILAVLMVFAALCIEGILHAIKYRIMYSRRVKKHGSNNFVLSSAYQNPEKTNLFFLAHMDSKSEKPHPHPLFLIIYLSVQIGTILFSTHLIVYAVFNLFSPLQNLHSTYVFVYGLILGGIDMLRILTRYGQGNSPGANDDAIGCAVCLILQRYFDDHPLQNVTVTCVLTGSEEVGEAGAYNFIKSKQPSLDRSKNHFIALDGLTSNKVYYFHCYGLRRTPFSPLILRGIQDLIRDQNPVTAKLQLIQRWMPPPVNTDHSPVIDLGYPAFVLTTPEKVSHSALDTPERINYNEVGSFVEFVIALVNRIDKNLV